MWGPKRGELITMLLFVIAVTFVLSVSVWELCKWLIR